MAWRSYKKRVTLPTVVVLPAFTGVQIGRAVITGESVWVDSEGVPAYDLRPTATAFSATTYPELALKYPSLITPTHATPQGSPHPYKIVADYTGV